MKKNNFKHPSHKSGMTIIEILMVIALIALIIGTVGKNVFSKFSGGKRKITKIYLSEIKGSLDQYKLDCNDYPKSISALIQNPGNCPSYATEGYLGAKKKIPQDPYGCDPFYSYDGQTMVLKSLAQGCQEGGEGEGTDILFEE